MGTRTATKRHENVTRQKRWPPSEPASLNSGYGFSLTYDCPCPAERDVVVRIYRSFRILRDRAPMASGKGRHLLFLAARL